MYSSIQVWPTSDAPAWLLNLVGSGVSCDWVAFVPEDLNDEEVIGLLLRNAGKTATTMMMLADGSVLLTGQFDKQEEAGRTLLERRSAGREKARAAASR